MSKTIYIAIFLMVAILGGLLTLAILDGDIVEDVEVVEEIIKKEDSGLIENNFENDLKNKTCSIDALGNISSECSVDVNNLEDDVVRKDDKKKEIKEIFGTKKGDLAYNFELVNLSGEKVKLSDYRGKKPVIVEFWNAWCHNCQREMPKLQKTYEKYDGKFEIIGVNLLPNKDFSGSEDSKEEIISFVKKYKITFPIILDDKLLAARKYEVKATNHHFLINTDGTIYDSFFIDLEEKILEDFLEFNEIK